MCAEPGPTSAEDVLADFVDANRLNHLAGDRHSRLRASGLPSILDVVIDVFDAAGATVATHRLTHPNAMVQTSSSRG
jgi:hypothetical protein